MPNTEVRLFQDEDGTVPLLDWLDQVPEKVCMKCTRAVARLSQLGFELHVGRRKEAAYLGNGLYELRVRHGSVNYRMLYFFYGKEAIVVTHGLQKERKVPNREINLALRRKRAYEENPERHTYLS